MFAGCTGNIKTTQRIPVAEVGKVALYYDELPQLIQKGINESDSIALIQNYVNKWAKRELLLQKAEENLSPEVKNEIENQLEETRANLVIYQYQRQIMLEKLDTVITESELENYYASNEKSFALNSNIVKALFIKLPVETPDLDTIRYLARSNKQNDLQLLEKYCYQFAEKFDDFNEKWVLMDRLSFELPQEIENEERFLRRSSFYETTDSSSVYLINIRDYRLRATLAPFEYVKDDINRIILNSRRFEFIQSLENAIYNEALKEKSFKIY
jgi:predicted house-cleaning noncanonical NTP pyrophosphatase (MazG superfamily)